MHKFIFESIDLEKLINSISEQVSLNIIKAVGNQHYPINDVDEPLSRKQAAKYLKITLPTLDRYRRNGVIPYHQTGRTVYFKRSEIDKHLAVNIKKSGLNRIKEFNSGRF